MGARVREVVGHSATIAPSRRYHFADQTVPIVTISRYQFPVYLSSVIRCFIFILLIIRPCRPLIPLCDRVAAVNNPLTA